MNHFEDHADGILEVQEELDEDCPTFTWNSVTYKALPGGAVKRKNLGAGGFSIESDLMITVHMAQFGNATPQAQRDAMLKTSLLYLGTSYKIDSVTIFPGGKLLRLECNDPAQGA